MSPGRLYGCDCDCCLLRPGILLLDDFGGYAVERFDSSVSTSLSTMSLGQAINDPNYILFTSGISIRHSIVTDTTVHSDRTESEAIVQPTGVGASHYRSTILPPSHHFRRHHPNSGSTTRTSMQLRRLCPYSLGSAKHLLQWIP
jgi:hypothetical protein